MAVRMFSSQPVLMHMGVRVLDPVMCVGMLVHHMRVLVVGVGVGMGVATTVGMLVCVDGRVVLGHL